jgi:hypothetical protein
MSEAYTGVGTLSDEKTVILDRPTHLPPGRVRVIVELLTDDQPEKTWLTTLNDIRRSLLKSGYRPRTRSEIDEQIQTERDSWRT